MTIEVDSEKTVADFRVLVEAEVRYSPIELTHRGRAVEDDQAINTLKTDQDVYCSFKGQVGSVDDLGSVDLSAEEMHRTGSGCCTVRDDNVT